jgi:valyl-tRNA synthetase
MSKSLGNGVDPMDVIEQYGCDSLRYYLTTNSSPGMDLRYIEEKVESSWNYINKIWNISRYVLMNVDERIEIDYKNLGTVDKWILSELSNTTEQVDKYYEKYEFVEVARILYNFTKDTFASWYVEMSKLTLETEGKQTEAVLLHVLESILKLLHPFMPFVTEEIYTKLPGAMESISIADWPKETFMDDKARSQVNVLIDVIHSVRNTRGEKNVAFSKGIDMYIKADSIETETNLKEMTSYIEKFCNPSNLIFGDYTEGDNAITIVLKNATVILPLAGLINLEEEKTRLEKELGRLKGEIKRAEGMLSNEKFTSRAPEAKVNAEKEKLENYKKQYDEVEAILKSL